MTASESALTTVRQMFAEYLGIAVEAVPPNATPDTLAGWDSVCHLQVLTALEQVCEVEFTMEEMADLAGVDAIAAAVSEKLARR